MRGSFLTINPLSNGSSSCCHDLGCQPLESKRSKAETIQKPLLKQSYMLFRRVFDKKGCLYLKEIHCRIWWTALKTREKMFPCPLFPSLKIASAIFVTKQPFPNESNFLKTDPWKSKSKENKTIYFLWASKSTHIKSAFS
jgi:hypothetical protein